MIERVAARAGLPPPICEKALEAFEGTCGQPLVTALKGTRHNHAYVIDEMARRTGEPERTCQVIMEAFEQVMDDSVRGKPGLRSEDP
ncbi:hypothetical protein [Dyella sp. EPa41]|uniref:hypothetical protein n=1 Tax=Dyella sp. EPa41 TaxID=1561194 RepID=UPI0019158D2C|nr:hypothetical protein [Dyella sp. EPa41]